jgi:hypothetical protein
VREAQAELAALRASGGASPMIETLAARVQQAAGDGAGALKTLRHALQRYPGRLSALETESNRRTLSKVPAGMDGPTPRTEAAGNTRARSAAHSGRIMS